MDFDEFAKGIAKGAPLGRIGTAEEFANLACFLASEQGSSSPAQPSISMAVDRPWSSVQL